MQKEERAIREPQRRLLVLSESPIEQIWTLLSMWESPEIAKKLISSRAIKDNVKISEEMLKSKALALAYCIRTARENILGSTESLTLKMVANYYGCMWFASAMMVADPRTDVDLPRLERFTRFGHGLGNTSFQGGSFPDSEFVYVKEHGFFPQFIKWISPNISMENVVLRQTRVEDYEDISEGNKPFAVSLSDMFARIPELKDTYEYISDRLGLAFQINHSSRNTGEDFDDAMSSGNPVPPSMPKRRRNYTWLNLRVPLDCPEEHLRANGPPLEDLSIQDYAGDRSWAGKLIHDIGAHWHEHLPTYKSPMSPTCWIKPVFGEIHDAFTMHLMLLYLLSILTRYRPAVWREIVEGEYNAYRPLIMNYNAVFTRVIPEIVLRRIAPERVHITTPGSLFAPT